MLTLIRISIFNCDWLIQLYFWFKCSKLKFYYNLKLKTLSKMPSGNNMSAVGYHCDSNNQNSQEESYESSKLINEHHDFLKLSKSEYSKKTQRVAS